MLKLARNGIPWDVIMGMDVVERQGYCMALGSLDGGEFDWTACKWKDRK